MLGASSPSRRGRPAPKARRKTGLRADACRPRPPTKITLLLWPDAVRQGAPSGDEIAVPRRITFCDCRVQRAPVRAVVSWLSAASDGTRRASFRRGDAPRLATREFRGRLDAASAATSRFARRLGAARDLQCWTAFVVGALGQIALRRAVAAHARSRSADCAIDAMRFGFLRLRLAAADLLFRPVPFSFGCHPRRIGAWVRECTRCLSQSLTARNR